MPNKKITSENRKEKSVGKKKKILVRIARWFLWMFFIIIFGVLIASGAAYWGYLKYSKNLPSISSLKKYQPPAITMVYSDDGKKIAEFFKERRIVIPLSKIPKNLINAFVAAEDSRFWKHRGIDWISVVRASLKNIEAWTIVQGGSTITQQVTKAFLLTPERKWERKIKEAILAQRIEEKFSKEEILFLYLNQIYLGHGAYGVQAAAGNYFRKDVGELNLAECAMIAGLPQAPTQYSPFLHPEIAKKRQLYVLNRMLAEDYIDGKQLEDARKTELDIKPRQNLFREKVPFYTEHVRREIEKTYGKDSLYKGGLQIHTAVNIEMQEAARSAMDKGLRELDKRQGYRGPVAHIEIEEYEARSKTIQETLSKTPLKKDMIVEGIVIKVDDGKKAVTVRMGDSRGTIKLSDMKWARKPNPKVSEGRIGKPSLALKAGDVILVKVKGKHEKKDLWNLALEQTPLAQGALLCVEAGTGHVKAMLGGRDFRETQFNRAVQSRRQPGSAFKPIVYAAALDKGFTPASVIIDNAIVFRDVVRDMKWKPKSFDRKFHGPTLLRTSLAKSRNLASIQILEDISIDYAIDYAKKLGITSELSRDLSIALGSSGVSLLELVRAYSVFCNEGLYIEPVFITKILDRDGNVIFEPDQDKKQVIEKTTAFLMSSILQSVVTSGTGQRVKKLGRPAAGKTGTTNNLYDAWFMGYTPGFVTGTWVGFDESKSLGPRETGSKAASPIWLGFMKKILEGRPVLEFKEPDGIITTMIDAKTGLLPIPETAKIIKEKFKEGTEPTEYTKKKSPILEKHDFRDLFGAEFEPSRKERKVARRAEIPPDAEDPDAGELELVRIWGRKPNGPEESSEIKPVPDPPDFEILGIRFFESGDFKPAESDRDYSTRFEKTKTKSVWTEVEIGNFDENIGFKRHDIEWIYYRPGGGVQGSMKRQFVVNPRSRGMKMERGWGWSEPGQWPEGVYRVSVKINGWNAGEKSFTIY